MKNLAGVKNCDTFIKRELTAAGIPCISEDHSHQEVSAKIAGQLGPFHFVRAWYYWVVDGPVPLEVAQKLYKDPLGLQDVRVVGYADNTPPEQWVEWYNTSGERCITQEEYDEITELIEKGLINPELGSGFAVFPEDRSGLKEYIKLYHIDSLEGLILFVNTLKDAGLV